MVNDKLSLLPHPRYVSEAHYRQAVIKLVNLANMNVGGSRVAAQVLLSLYNGSEFQVNLCDLCQLDPSYYQYAILAIRGRVEFMIEPHDVLGKEGGQVFEKLWQDWQHLHVSQRTAA